MNEIAKSGETPSTKQLNQACARYEDKMLDRAFEWVKKSGGTSIVVSTLYLISIPSGIDRHRASTWMEGTLVFRPYLEKNAPLALGREKETQGQ